MAANTNSQKCGDCFYYRKAPLDPRGGTCRINVPAPVPMQSPQGFTIVGIWPPVTPDDWCGMWKPLTLQS
jgi:hypothetical protein